MAEAENGRIRLPTHVTYCEYDYHAMSGEDLEQILIVVGAQLSLLSGLCEAGSKTAGREPAIDWQMEETDRLEGIESDCRKELKRRAGQPVGDGLDLAPAQEAWTGSTEHARQFGRSLILNTASRPGALFVLTGGAS